MRARRRSERRRHPVGHADDLHGLIYVAFMLQLKLLCSVPYIGTALTLLLSALLHAFDSFEFLWDAQGCSVAEKFGLIEHHWPFFTGYGALLAALSIRLRFWDLFAVRTVSQERGRERERDTRGTSTARRAPRPSRNIAGM